MAKFKVTWETKYLGEFNTTVDGSRLSAFTRALKKLDLKPKVEKLDDNA